MAIYDDEKDKLLQEMEGQDVEEEDSLSNVFGKWIKMRLKTGKKKMAEVE